MKSNSTQNAGDSMTGEDTLFIATLAGDVNASFQDKEFLCLEMELNRLWKEEFALESAGEISIDRWKAEDDFIAAADATAAVVRRICKMPARSLVGIAVKARALAWCRNGHAFDEDGEPLTTDERLARQIASEFMALVAG